MVKTIISREMLSKSQLDALDKDLPEKINGLT
jgi:hypothetical protein